MMKAQSHRMALCKARALWPRSQTSYTDRIAAATVLGVMLAGRLALRIVGVWISRLVDW